MFRDDHARARPSHMPGGIANTAALAGLAAALAGCVPVATAPVQIDLRHADSQAPIPNAVVRVTGLNPTHPLRVSDYLRARPPEFSAARTDQDGRALVSAPVDRPFQMTVILPNLSPGTVFFNDGLANQPDLGRWWPLPAPIEPGREAISAELRLTSAP